MTLKRILIAVAILVVAASLFWFIQTQIRKKIPEGLLIASGRIEGREVTIAPKIQGRLKSLLIDEGDTVKKGQLIAEIVSDQLDARYKNTQENVLLTQAQMEQASADLSFTEKNTSASINAAEAALDKKQHRVRSIYLALPLSWRILLIEVK